MSRMKALWIGLVAIALMAPPALAAPHWMFALNGGAALPTGDFGDEQQLNANTGFQFGGEIGYMVNDMWAIGVNGSWSQNKSGLEGETVADYFAPGDQTTFDEAKFKTLQFGAHAKFFLPMTGSPMSPYLLGGVGMYNVKGEASGTTTPSGGSPTAFSAESEFDSRFGGRIGLGTAWKVNEMWSIGAEGDYNFISEDKDKTGGISSLQYASVRATLTLHVIPK